MRLTVDIDRYESQALWEGFSVPSVPWVIAGDSATALSLDPTVTRCPSLDAEMAHDRPQDHRLARNAWLQTRDGPHAPVLLECSCGRKYALRGTTR